jgi:membrane protein implicated in regulation of membrane protease activity
MNYCVVACAVPEVTAAALYDFTGRATQHARANVMGTVGWTAASVVIAGLVGQRVYPDAAQAASAKSGNQFGGETRMVAVDVSAGQMYAFVGGKFWGAAVQGSVNAKLTYCFPQPAEVYQQVQWQQAQQQQQQQLPPAAQQPPPGWQQQQQAPYHPPQGQPPYGY